MFNVSLATLGAGLAFFFASLTLATKDGKTELSVCGVCGTLASLSLVLIAAIPMDLHEGLHLLAMFSWLLLMVPMSAAWMCWLAEWYPQSVIWPIVNKSLMYGLLIYLPAAMTGFGASWQKSVILLAFVWLQLLCVQLVAVLWNDRAFELQMNRMSKLGKELSARHLNRIRSATGIEFTDSGDPVSK